MYYTLTGFCNYLNAAMTYTLTKSDYSSLDSWMIWNALTMTVSGLVPPPKYSSVELRLTGCDSSGSCISQTFTVYI